MCAECKLINDFSFKHCSKDFQVTLLNITSFNKHALNLGSDERLITIDIICLTETQLQSRAKPRRFDYFKNLKWFMTKMETNFRKSRSFLEIPLTQFHKLKCMMHTT